MYNEADYKIKKDMDKSLCKIKDLTILDFLSWSLVLLGKSNQIRNV